MNEDCDLCGRGLRYGEDTTCRECVSWRKYWNALTPAEQRREQFLMDAYTEQAEHL